MVDLEQQVDQSVEQETVTAEPTSSMARPPGEDEDFQKAMAAFSTAMGKKPVEKAAEKPVEAPKVEEKKEPAPDFSAELKSAREQAAAFQSELSALRAQLQQREDLSVKAKRNPIEFLKESGLTLEQVTDWLQNGDQSKTAAEVSKSAMERELEEYRARDKKAAEERAAAEAESKRSEAGKRYVDEVLKPAVTEAEFPLSFAMHGDKLFDQLLQASITIYRTTGVERPAKEVAQQFENSLREIQQKLSGKRERETAPSLKTLQSATQVPNITKQDADDDEAAMAAALAKLKQLRQGNR